MSSFELETQPDAPQGLNRSVFSTLGFEPATALGTSDDAAGDAMLARHEADEQTHAAHSGWEAMAAAAGEAAMLDLYPESDQLAAPSASALGVNARTITDGALLPVSSSEGEELLVSRHPSHSGCCGGRERVSVPLASKPVHLLGQWTASAISGNDITSSVLYMGG